MPSADLKTGKIRLWERLEIIVGEGPQAGRYIARLEDIHASVLVIDTPEYVAGSSLLRNGAECTVVITRDDAIYQFASVITVEEHKGRRVYLLDAPDRYQRVQRRQFVRIDLRKRVAVAMLGRKGSTTDSIESIPWLGTTTVNVSGGGLLIEDPSELTVGDLLLVKPDFFPVIGLPIAVAALVRRIDRPRDGRQVGIEFLRVDQISTYFDPKGVRVLPESVFLFDQVHQNKLVTYVFREQVKLRQKGLL